jgi:mRNA interferase MazF
MKKRDIVLINVPFTDLSEVKLRPALIIGKIHDDFLCCFISSNAAAKTKQDVFVKKNTANNLKIDSVIKCGKLFTLHNSLIEKKIGLLSADLYDMVVKKITGIIH